MDLIFHNYPEEISDVSVVDEFSSDHLVVNFSLVTRIKRLKNQRRTVYNLKRADLVGLKSALNYLPWVTAFVDNDIDSSVTRWYDLFSTCIDEFVPKVVIKNANRPPWVDRDVPQLIKKKNRIRRRAKSKDSAHLWERFRKLRHQV